MTPRKTYTFAKKPLILTEKPVRLFNVSTSPDPTSTLRIMLRVEDTLVQVDVEQRDAAQLANQILNQTLDTANVEPVQPVQTRDSGRKTAVRKLKAAWNPMLATNAADRRAKELVYKKQCRMRTLRNRVTNNTN